MTTIEARTYSTSKAARITGLTKRQLDYWLRCDVLGSLGLTNPGSGARIVWREEHLPVLRVLQALNAMGAGHSVLRRVADELAPMDFATMEPWLIVDRSGGMTWARDDELATALVEVWRGCVWLLNLPHVLVAAA